MKTLTQSVLAMAVFSFCMGTACASSAGLIGKSFTSKPVPANSDANKQEFGGGYFNCGGSMRDDGTTFNFLRKGAKAKCDTGTRTVALTRMRPGTKEELVLDTVDIKAPANHYIQVSCQGADLAMSKHEEAEYYTQHAAARNVVNDKLVPVTDLKKVRCVNDGF